jgi:hypothetical protein
MASFEQDLIIFEDDTLLLQYTFTDLETTFNGSWDVWWGAWTYDDWTGDRTGSGADHKKHTAWTSPASLNTDTNDILLVTNDVIVRVFFNQADFDASSGPLATDTEYYTELVVADNGNENRSIVAATGKLYVSSSMFSIAGYRPSE